MPKQMALLGVPTTKKLAKEDEKDVINPTFHTLTWASVAMGRTMGPRAATVAPSLMKLVIVPVSRLTPMTSPSPR
jgi:hypothetical protein